MQLTRRLLIGALISGTITLLALVTITYRPPFVASLDDMATSGADRPTLSERCESSGGTTYSAPTCYWTLKLDDGKRLGWPWPDPKGSVAEVQAYLRHNSPIEVRSWRGKVYQIVVKDGQTFLDYHDAASFERERQWFWIAAGLLVAACSTARIMVELTRVRRVMLGDIQQRLARYLDVVCLVGGLILLLAGGMRIWWQVVALAAFALGAGLVCEQVPLEWMSTCEPSQS